MFENRCVVCGDVIPEGRQVCRKCDIATTPDFLNKKFNFPTDPVNHPSHYSDGKIEVIDYIEDKRLGFCLGNAVKYISRSGKKDPDKTVEDLQKAIWYINRYIKEVTKDD